MRRSSPKPDSIGGDMRSMDATITDGKPADQTPAQHQTNKTRK